MPTDGCARQHKVSVRKRIVFLVALTSIALIAVLTVCTGLFLEPRFLQFERDRAADSVERAKVALEGEIVQLKKIAMDNATFDNTYEFVRSKSPAYLHSNYGEGVQSTLARENYQVLAFVDTAGHVIASKGYDPKIRRDVEIAPDIMARLSAKNRLISQALSGVPISGILLAKGAPMLIAALPILNSEENKPLNGVLVMGSYLKPEDIEQLGRTARLELSFGRVDDPHLSPDFQGAQRHLHSKTPVMVQVLDNDKIAGYVLFHDIYGHPALILKATLPRTIHHQGQLALLCLAIAIALSGIVFGTLIQILLEHLLLSRLNTLDENVTGIAKSADSSARVRSEGNDELSRLGYAINRMLDSLQVSEEQKHQAENRYRTFMDHSPLLAAIRDETGRYVYVNKPFLDTFRTSAEQTLDNYTESFLGAEIAEVVHRHDREVLARGVPMQFEESIPTPDGEDRQWLSFRFPLSLDGDKRYIGVLKLDVTARNQAARDLQEAKEAAEKALSIKSQFLANMSHELRTPMNGILGLSELLGKTKIDSQQREYVSSLKFSAESLLGIVDDILDLSKIEAGKMEISASNCHLHRLLAQSVELIRVLAAKKNVNVFLEIAPEVAPQVMTDATRLRQILLNLLGNAVKFTNAGEIRLSARVSEQSEEGYFLHFIVADSGIGIPEDKQKLIFERFAQVDGSLTRQFGGVGLGLAISSRLVEMMNGRIWVESREGEGSRFHFTAKVGRCEEMQAERQHATMASAARCTRHTGRLKILVAEDNRVNQLVIDRMLNQLGHSTALARNGREAAELLAGGEFDLLITDVQMPEMDGYKLAAAIRSRERVSGQARLPIVGLTAHAFAEDYDRCLKAGMDAHLAKPARQDDLERTISELTHESFQRAERRTIDAHRSLTP